MELVKKNTYQFSVDQDVMLTVSDLNNGLVEITLGQERVLRDYEEFHNIVELLRQIQEDIAARESAREVTNF